MKCLHPDFNEYFGKCPDCGAVFEDVLKEEIENCTTKDHARELALDWQTWQQEESLSYGELAEWQAYFEKLGRKHGLLKEFRENGII